MTCLSAAAPCDFWRTFQRPCSTCQESIEQTDRTERDRALDAAIRLLRSHGYTVITPGGDGGPSTRV